MIHEITRVWIVSGETACVILKRDGSTDSCETACEETILDVDSRDLFPATIEEVRQKRYIPCAKCLAALHSKREQALGGATTAH